MGILLIIRSLLAERWGDAMGEAVRTIGSVRRSGKGGVSEMLAPQA